MDPVPVPAGMKPATPVPGLVPVAPELLLGMRAAAFRRIQAERDDHAAVCHGRTLDPNPCWSLWSWDERLRILWAEIQYLGGHLGDVYQPESCSATCRGDS